MLDNTVTFRAKYKLLLLLDDSSNYSLGLNSCPTQWLLNAHHHFLKDCHARCSRQPQNWSREQFTWLLICWLTECQCMYQHILSDRLTSIPFKYAIRSQEHRHDQSPSAWSCLTFRSQWWCINQVSSFLRQICWLEQAHISFFDYPCVTHESRQPAP